MFLSLAFLLLNLTLLVLGQGTQFITGPCKHDSDCASACCGFNTGLCAGPVIAQERDGGCGFGNPEPNDTAARAFLGEAAATTTMAAAAQATSTNTGAGNKAGKQFITGPCTSDADCAEGCCGFNTGLCAGPIVAQERDGGCGFGNAQPNDNAAQALRGGTPASSSAPAANTAASRPPTSSNGAGNGAGKQFITGSCLSDKDCASACCGFNTGLCAGPIIAQERDGGCGFGDAQPNDTAAQALRNSRKRLVSFMA